ncbi:FKBP-type peptidyl-prolyl cis-trans isomerase [Segetibacter sp.]|jgi:FKBP-type peptidyl-prolyl cis-trans isomerase FklB|uniref:FKBP-type peptidyl-prolyl cis-trans isomerase n=1 Tax=Segetibacter sp. TaxID=2231182 RepID=UPI0026347763|nr:FKBP-type peptidyl-prolyl cis-trans isomerase [Segetibacter sp.]MCW3080605.1 FKBP-type peptidyl-prolyl cis-trans isomerase [Segetibacter sp.]
MKKVFLVPSVLMLCVSLHAQTKKTTKTVAQTRNTASAAAALRTSTDSISYAFGLSLGQYIKSQGLTSLNYAMLNKAIDQCIKGQKTTLDMNQANQVMQGLAESKMKKVSSAEKQKGTAFLTKNKTRKEVVQTPSGLQYEVLVKGTGPVPSKSDTVSAHYRGSLIDGKEFDNSYKRGEPLTIPVGSVIPGWTEALTMMPVGSKWKLFIPSSIGYGDVGAGQDIPGGATLVFEVELLGISNKK